MFITKGEGRHLAFFCREAIVREIEGINRLTMLMLNKASRLARIKISISIHLYQSISAEVTTLRRILSSTAIYWLVTVVGMHGIYDCGLRR